MTVEEELISFMQSSTVELVLERLLLLGRISLDGLNCLDQFQFRFNISTNIKLRNLPSSVHSLQMYQTDMCPQRTNLVVSLSYFPYHLDRDTKLFQQSDAAGSTKPSILHSHWRCATTQCLSCR